MRMKYPPKTELENAEIIFRKSFDKIIERFSVFLHHVFDFIIIFSFTYAPIILKLSRVIRNKIGASFSKLKNKFLP